jgi:hypothetical protein
VSEQFQNPIIIKKKNREKFDTTNTQMHDNPLSWLVTGTSAGFTIVLKHRAPLARGHLPAKKIKKRMDFC